MYYDALTLCALRDELDQRMIGGRVQRIVRPDDLSIGLEIYSGSRHQLLLSAHPQSPGILLSPSKLRRGTESPSPVQLLLAKHVRGARLQAIEEPELERILRFRFRGQEGRVSLVVEVMGRLSNIILLGKDDIILDAVKRVPSSVNRYRTILPQRPYKPPPPQDKEHPLLLTRSRLQQALDEDSETPLWRQLVRLLRGTSPLLAREISFRASGSIEPPLPLTGGSAQSVIEAVDELFHMPETRAWSPCVAYVGEGDDRHPAAYAPYELTHYSDRERSETISEAILSVRESTGALDGYAQARARLHEIIDRQRGRTKARLASLQESNVSPDEVEFIQKQANAILAMAWSIEPGQGELLVDMAQFDMTEGSERPRPMRISLDPTLSPSENAQKLFREYRKMQAAQRQVPALIAGTELETKYLQQLDTEIDLAEGRQQLDEVEHELLEAGYLRRTKRKASPKAKGRVLRLQAEDGTPIYVGRSSRQNDEVTFGIGAPDDVWLHAHDVPGAHVIIKRVGGSISDDTLQKAARLAAYYSGARNDVRVQVDYAERRHVRRIRGARPGMVTYRHEQTLSVRPDPESGPDDEPKGEVPADPGARR